MSLVSFIIPVFEVEKFLPCCLDSIQGQTMADIEIVCINDASPDQSKNIIEAYSRKDPRIKLLDLKKNRGKGYARNQGIKVARGQYIRMVDPDDFIPIDSTEKLLNTAIQYESNFVRGGFWRCRQNGQKLRKGGRYPEKLLINASFHKDKELWFFDQHTTYLFKTDLIKKAGAQYDENMSNGQDVAFLLPLVSYMEKVSLIPETVYFYRRNQKSVMNSHKNKQYYLNLFRLYEMEYEQLAAKGFQEQVDYFIFYHLSVILPKIVLPSIPDNLQRQESLEILTNLKNVIDTYDIKNLCFASQYSWQKERTVPLISKQIVLLLSENYIREAYEVIKEYGVNKKKIKAQKKKIRSLLDSTSWRITAPLRQIIKTFRK